MLVEATAFTNHYDDLIVAVGSFAGSSRYQTDNISNARASGLELAFTGAPPVRLQSACSTSARASATRSSTRRSSPSIRTRMRRPPSRSGQDLLRRPTHQFFADVILTDGRLAAFVRAGGRSRTLDVEPSFGTFGGLFDAPGYQVWSAGAVVADRQAAGSLRTGREPVRSRLRGGLRLPGARPPCDRRCAHCCRPMTSRSAMATRRSCTACRSTFRPAASSG